jgi:hypothetical protein
MPRVSSSAPYPGGCFAAYDPASEAFTCLARAPHGDGIITMSADLPRGCLYGLTWPAGRLLRYDIAEARLSELGNACGAGEAGSLADGTYQPVCRSLAVDPGTGGVYWSNAAGDILAREPGDARIHTLMPGALDALAGSRRRVHPHWGAMWRHVLWRAADGAFYGVLGTVDPILFRFDARGRAVEPVAVLSVDRRAGLPRQRRAVWATLALAASADGETLFYLAMPGAPLTPDRRRLRAAVHCLTYHVPTGMLEDHGRLRTADGRWIAKAESLEVLDDTLYTVAWLDAGPPSESAPDPMNGDTNEDVCLVAFHLAS